MVYLTLYNKLWIKIESDSRECMEFIKDRFTFHVPGYIFMPLYKAGKWDGTTKLFDYKNRLLPYGLLFDLVKWLKKGGYDIKADDELKNMFGSVDLPDIKYNLKYKPRYYQDDIIKSCINFRKGIFTSPTASGKSIIISYIINFLHESNISSKSLIVVPTTSLILQFHSDLLDYGMDVNMLGKFYADEKDWDKPILISTWQSLTYDNEKLRKSEIANLVNELKRKSLKRGDRDKFKTRLDFLRSKEYIQNVKDLMNVRQNLLSSVDCAIVDEVQTAKSTEVGGLMRKLDNADYRLGCTGTIPNSKLDQCNIKSFIGPIIKRYTVKELTDAGYLNKCEIHRIIIKYKKPLKGNLSEIKQQLFESKFRQNVFNNIIKEDKGNNVLFLVNNIEKEGKVLENNLKEAFPDKQIKYIHGKVKAKEREEWRLKCEQHTDILIIATYSLFQAGINIPSLNRIFLASSFKGEVRILQSIGRALRTKEDKSTSIIYDICDNVKYLIKQANTRKHIYETEEFEVKDITVKEGH